MRIAFSGMPLTGEATRRGCELSPVLGRLLAVLGGRQIGAALTAVDLLISLDAFANDPDCWPRWAGATGTQPRCLRFPILDAVSARRWQPRPVGTVARLPPSRRLDARAKAHCDDRRLVAAHRSKVVIECPFRDLLAHPSTAGVCGAEVESQPHSRIHHVLARRPS
jgi:hypothetical protein